MARKTEFELETAAGMDILPVPDCKISINGQAPNDSPYASIDIKGKYYFIKDRDLERFAVNILKALNQKNLNNMKIKIEIECESAGQFMQHLLSMYEAGLIYIHERKKVTEDWDETDEFDIVDVNEGQVLDDNNCYGHHGVEIIPEP